MTSFPAIIWLQKTRAANVTKNFASADCVQATGTCGVRCIAVAMLHVRDTNAPSTSHGARNVSIGRSKNKSVSTQTILLNFPRQIPESTQGECQTSQKPFRRQLNRDMLVF